MNDRIKLAEAMGWIWHDEKDPTTVRRNTYWEIPGKGIKYSFAPFTDANDDYAVLKFARMAWKPAHTMEEHHKWPTFVANLKLTPDRYHIGDYARAALKVIG
jgi:hypothetical protein